LGVAELSLRRAVPTRDRGHLLGLCNAFRRSVIFRCNFSGIIILCGGPRKRRAKPRATAMPALSSPSNPFEHQDRDNAGRRLPLVLLPFGMKLLVARSQPVPFRAGDLASADCHCPLSGLDGRVRAGEQVQVAVRLPLGASP
jgi:hypothetical protein